MLNLKRAFVLCLVFVLALGTVSFADDSDRLITVFVDGNKINFDVNPVLENGRTLVPMRFIFEALGATVTWNDATQTATAVKGDITIDITINKPELVKNGKVIVLDVPAKLVNDRTLVPVRAVSEGMEAKVEWIDATSQVIITNPASATGEYSHSELSANDMNKLKSDSVNLISAFTSEVLPASSIDNKALAQKILSKDNDVLDFVKNAWTEYLIVNIKRIQDESDDTYTFNVSASTPAEAVKKAAADYVSLAGKTGIGADDIFKNTEFTDMKSGAVMLLCEYVHPKTSAVSYAAIVALADGTVGLCEVAESVETKDGFINNINSKLN